MRLLGRATRGLGALGAMVANGATLTYQATWLDYPFNKSNTINLISQNLASNGMVLRSYRQLNAVTLMTQKSIYSWELIVQVKNGLGFNSPDDAAAVINHAVYVATNKPPQTYSIVAVSGVPTGEPSASSGNKDSDESGGGNHKPDDMTFNEWLKSNWGIVAAGALALVVLPKVLDR